MCQQVSLTGMSPSVRAHRFGVVPARIVVDMNLVQTIERGLDWLAAPKRLPGRLEMETQRGKRLELEVVSFTVRMPIAGGAVVRVPLFFMLMPRGSSPIEGTHANVDDGRAVGDGDGAAR
jgi:hypothetical protein